MAPGLRAAVGAGARRRLPRAAHRRAGRAGRRAPDRLEGPSEHHDRRCPARAATSSTRTGTCSPRPSPGTRSPPCRGSRRRAATSPPTPRASRRRSASDAGRSPTALTADPKASYALLAKEVTFSALQRVKALRPRLALLRRDLQADLPGRRRGGQPARLRRLRPDAARRRRARRRRLPRGHRRRVRRGERAGPHAHPRHGGRREGCEARRHREAHDRSRPAVLRAAGAGAARQADGSRVGLGRGRGGEDGQAARRRRLADRRPQRRREDGEHRRGGARFPLVHRAVRARVDHEGGHGVDAARLRRRDARRRTWSRPFRLRPPAVRTSTTARSTATSGSRSRACWSSRATPASRSSGPASRTRSGSRTSRPSASAPPTAVGFGAEAAGTFGANAPNWDPQTHYATMFGQGLTVSAVQMASAYQTLANGGVRLRSASSTPARRRTAPCSRSPAASRPG